MLYCVQESRPVIEVSSHETTATVPQTTDYVSKPLTTFGGNKSLGSADFLMENSHYKSEKSFDDGKQTVYMCCTYYT